MIDTETRRRLGKFVEKIPNRSLSTEQKIVIEESHIRFLTEEQYAQQLYALATTLSHEADVDPFIQRNSLGSTFVSLPARLRDGLASFCIQATRDWHIRMGFNYMGFREEFIPLLDPNLAPLDNQEQFNFRNFDHHKRVERIIDVLQNEQLQFWMRQGRDESFEPDVTSMVADFPSLCYNYPDSMNGAHINLGGLEDQTTIRESLRRLNPRLSSWVQAMTMYNDTSIFPRPRAATVMKNSRERFDLYRTHTQEPQFHLIFNRMHQEV